MQIKELLNKNETYSQEFRSDLEYLFFKAGAFDFRPRNILGSYVCSNHVEHLLSVGEFNRRCSVCKPVCKRQVTSNKGDRRVSKLLALVIWEYGQPHEKWTFYDQPICDQCRKHLTCNILLDDMRFKSDHIFGNIKIFFIQLDLDFLI